jgi:hypothetical protein
MQSSLLADPADRNIKAADVADFAEIAKIVEVATPTEPQMVQHDTALQLISSIGRLITIAAV